MVTDEKVALRSPIGSLALSALTFTVIFITHIFNVGLDLLVSALLGLLIYYRQEYSTYLLLAGLTIPLYAFLRSDASSVAPSNLSNFYVIAGILFLVAFIPPNVDWLGGMAGILCAILLVNNYFLPLILPVVAVLSVFRSLKSAAVATTEIALLGVFVKFMQFENLNQFSGSAAMTLLSYPLSHQTYSFLTYILTAIFGGYISSVLGSVYLSFIPVYFVIAVIITLITAFLARKYIGRLVLGPFSRVISAGLVGAVGSLLIFNLSSITLISTVAAMVLALVYLLLKPAFGTRPSFSISDIRSVFSPPAFVQSMEFDEKEGIIVNDRPGKSGKMAGVWNRLSGMEEVKQDLYRSVVLPIRNKDEAKRFGVRPAKGILLYGPPGTGKTTILRGLAGFLGVRYVEINPGEVLSKWFGESEQKMKKAFDSALSNPPCLVVIDEIDGLGRSRDTDSSDSGTTQRVLNVILMSMDSIFRSQDDVIVVATTNRLDIMDKALLRPGRFDKIIYVGPPGVEGRARIFEGYLAGNKAVDDRLDYKRLAEISERFTGADIEGVVNSVMASTFYRSVQSGNQKKSKTDTQGGKGQVVITQEILEEAIKSTRPSVTFSMLEEYERFRAEYQRERKIQKGWESEIPDVRFDEIGNLEKVKEELKEAFELPLKEPELMEKLKIRPVKGILLHGPPGNGKTLLAKAVATEFSANFFVVSGAELSKGQPSQAAARIKELFNVARDNVPSIVFIDEIDQIAPDRSNPIAEMFIPVTNQLLTELDGIRELKGVMVLAATNRPESIDKALLRANRLEKHIEIPYPDEESRKKILEVCLRGVVVSPDVSVEDIAKRCEGFSGADVQDLVNEAKKSVVRRRMSGSGGDESIGIADFESASKSRNSTKLKQ